MAKYSKVIFISRDDVTRGPMAEAIYKRLDTTGETKVCSRGLVVLFPEPVNPKAEMVLENHETACTKRISRQLTKDDCTENTLFLTMDRSEKDMLIRNYGQAEYVYTLTEYVAETEELADPYGGTLVDYQECYAQLVRLLKKTLYRINEVE
ncbi:hypothetical protein [Anaerolentibacter hominis]|uniref:arsenate reductase/protein-tyrosine-phosphatase family protein n=1 Tax=Anaerolentibacter hominis TaxID=3079009 RepID=UPI0031B8020C